MSEPAGIAVYTPDPQLRTPGRLVREMIRDLFASRELAWRLCARNITTQYRQTALGYVWAIGPPLMTSVLFILLNSANLLRAGETGVPYPVYVIVGTVAFGLFLDALNMPLNVIAAARGMLPKINFPHEALLLAGVAQILVNFAVKATLVVAILVVFRVPVQPRAVLAVIPLTGLLVIGIAVGVLLVPIGALFQDVVHALGVVASALVFLTPAAYTPPRVGLLGVITSWNPLTPLIMAARDLLVHGSSPQISTTLILVAGSIAALLVSWVVFRLAMPILIERMGS
jgi:lipopolysaccharide transport system permease protein